MFWVLAPVALVGIAAVIASSLSEDERQARIRWQSKRAEVEKTVEDHRKNIEKHIDVAQRSYDFAVLVDIHYSSHRIADSAYQLLEDARASISSISKIIDQAAARKNELKASIDGAGQDKRREFLAEIRSLNDFKEKVMEDMSTIRKQRDLLFSEVKRLNLQTGSLKEAIRDRCGEKGREWFSRLEQRSTARKKREGNERS